MQLDQKTQQSCKVEIGDGIDQDAKFVGDEREEEDNGHEEDQEDE
jgi:hypothetical protein